MHIKMEKYFKLSETQVCTKPASTPPYMQLESRREAKLLGTNIKEIMSKKLSEERREGGRGNKRNSEERKRMINTELFSWLYHK